MSRLVFRTLLFRFAAVLALAASAVSARAEPYISEFMASNTSTLRDEDQAFSDWIELHNPDAAPVDLGGWYLTDTAANPTRWQFPAVTVPAGGYLVVFASNKNRRDPARELHTNFALAVEGEYLALVKPDGVTIASEFAPAYPEQSANVSYGFAADPGGTLARAFFTTPTPGRANSHGTAGRVGETVAFSTASGPFAAPFLLEMTGAGAGQHIRYEAAYPSVAGGNVPEPTATSTAYAGPIPVEHPLVIRAAVFSDDLATRGRVSSVNFFQIDRSGPENVGAFSSHLPVLVLEQHGFGGLDKADGEQPAWLYGYGPRPAGDPVFGANPDFGTAVNMAVRGHSSALFPKRSYNLELTDELGRKTPRPLFSLGNYDEWALVGPYLYDPSLIRNSYAYALSRRIGRWAPRTQPVEVFLNPNGMPLDQTAYVGVYMLTDRVRIESGRVGLREMPANAVAPSEITGGYLLKVDFPDADEYSWVSRYLLEDAQSESLVVVASPKADKLSPAQRDYIRNYVEQMETTLVADHAAGWATRRYLDFIDRPSWVDHHILNTFAANPDAFERSAYFSKDRDGKLVAGPIWDFDRAFGSAADTRGDRWDVWQGENAVQVWHFGWWALLANDPEFMQDWVDRWQSLRRGELADTALVQLADQQAAAIGPEAAARDAAAFTDNISSFGGTHAGEMAHLKNWLAQRARWIDRQFVPPPTVTASGGNLVVAPAPDTQIAYTLDGSDPRALGGGIAPNAIVVSGPVTVPANSNLQARSYREEWQARFPGGPWSSAVGGPSSSPLAPKSRLVNISSRAVVGSGENALITGVVVADTAGKQYLARAVGPTLAAFGAEGTVPDPQLSIFTSEGVEWFRNNGWQNGPDPVQLSRHARDVGAFPLPAGSNDSALAVRLPAGAYTINITTPSGQDGIGLAELYELDSNGRTVNLSTRATVGTGDHVLIGGFVVQGAAYKRMLIRAIGPTLAAFGVGNAVLDPVLTIYSGSTVVASNERWGAAANAPQITAATSRVGAFQLGANSADAALLITLPPGAYTVEVRSRDGSVGVALLEIYDLP